jgi:hypothetical protein
MGAGQNAKKKKNLSSNQVTSDHVVFKYLS